jgi:hypothetical protein
MLRTAIAAAAVAVACQRPPPDTDLRMISEWMHTLYGAIRVVLDSLLREALPTTRAALTRLADSLANVSIRPARSTFPA